MSPPLLAALLALSAAGAQVRVEADTYRYRLLEVRFPSPAKTPFKPNETVWGHLYLPRGAGPRPPCALVLPVMAAPNVWIEMRFVGELLRAGYAVMWLEMPFQFHRRPHLSAPSGQAFLARTPEGLRRNFEQSIGDARAALSWLEGSGLVDPERLALFGVSLGAIVGASAYSRDERARAGVFLLGGADFPGLVFEGELTRAFARRAGLKPEELRRAWAGLEPGGRRAAEAGARVLLMNARGDKVIPERNALKLKEAFPGARQKWVPWGHYGAILHLSWLPTYVAWTLRGLLN